MNAPIIDPLQGAFPEVIEEYLEHGVMKCIAFNRPGTLLAAGCSDGSCVIWDFETRGIAKVFRDSESVAAITSICWSKNGHRILVAAADKSLKLWDVLKGEKVARIVLPQVLLHARLHPGSSIPQICLVCPLSSTPMLVDLQTSVTTPLPVYLPEKDNGAAPSRNKLTDGSVPFTPTAACFNKTGDLIYAGNAKGEILIIDCKTIQILAIVPIPGNAVIKNIVFSRNGQCLLTNSSDRIIRIYQSLLPSKDRANAINDLSSKVSDQDEVDRLKAVGSGCLSLIREFQDLVTKVLWKAPCFSGDGKWVIGGSANKGEHKIYIWDMETGHLVKILEGPKEALIDLAWHPTHPVVVSVSLTGLAYIWAKDYTENWSAFAPDFKELEENEEYIEGEDEFDLVPETEKENDSGVNEDEDVDILTVDKDSDFSDSDTSRDEVRYLPAEPSADAPEPKDQLISNPLKIENGSRSVSPLSEEAELNGHLANYDLSPMEDDAGGPPPSKRKRKPSEKVNGYA